MLFYRLCKLCYLTWWKTRAQKAAASDHHLFQKSIDVMVHTKTDQILAKRMDLLGIEPRTFPM